MKMKFKMFKMSFWQQPKIWRGHSQPDGQPAITAQACFFTRVENKAHSSKGNTKERRQTKKTGVGSISTSQLQKKKEKTSELELKKARLAVELKLQGCAGNSGNSGSTETHPAHTAPLSQKGDGWYLPPPPSKSGLWDRNNAGGLLVLWTMNIHTHATAEPL